MSDRKVSPELATRLESTPADEWIDVVIELRTLDAPPGTPSSAGGASRTRQERIQAMKNEFSARVAPIERAVRALGGEIKDAVWLNQSLAARLRASKVAALGDVEGVTLLDVPHRLKRE